MRAPSTLMSAHDELVWLAAFFSGEGCVSVGRNASGRAYLQVALSNTDKAAVERFRQRFGGSVYETPPGRSGNPLQRQMLWTWKLGATEDTRAFLHAVWHHLSDDKRASAERAIDAVEANPPVDRKAAWRTRRERYGASGKPA